MIDLTKVSSSLLAAYSYDASTQTLTITFARREGQEPSPHYHYKPVPQNIVDDFLTAKSQGSFFLREIKPKYACVKEEKPNADQDNRGDVGAV
jgi:hypothetical protein